MNVEYSPEEMDFYNAVTDFVETRFIADWDSAQGISFARIMPQRQVASCIPAMRSYLRDQAGANTLLRLRDWEGDDIGERANGRSRIGSNEQEAAKRLLRAMDKLGGRDTKFAQFLDALRNLEVEFSEQGITLKVIVFSYFKRTLDYLNSKLADCGYAKQCVMIHGDINPKIREKTVERFRDNPEIKILLSSEVGSEGLDFQFCNVMFNNDLPWNPMRVEQRIGRLDRYGQQSDKILIYNFSVKNTIDDIILARLYHRINLFERYIGDLEVILGDQIASLTREMFNPRLNSEQKADRAEQTAIAIENQIKELEEFESQSSKFLGQDDFFNEEISAIKESKRFITSQEVELLLTSFLEPVYNLFRISAAKASTTICRLVLSFLSQFFHSRRHFSSQAKDRSTTHRFGSTTKRCSSLRFTTATAAPNKLCTPSAKGFPVYPPSTSTCCTCLRFSRRRSNIAKAPARSVTLAVVT